MTEFERARNDISRLLDGYVKKRIRKSEALDIATSILNNVRNLGYEEGYGQSAKDLNEMYVLGIERDLLGD